MPQSLTRGLNNGSKNAKIVAIAMVSDCIADMSNAAKPKNAHGAACDSAAKVNATAK